MDFLNGAMVMMCSTTWAGVLPDISARGHCAFGGIPLHARGFPFLYQYHAVIIRFQTTFIRFLV